MKVLCVNSTGNFKAGETYNACPVLCGYQISADTSRSFRDADIKDIEVFLDKEYSKHFCEVKS